MGSQESISELKGRTELVLFAGEGPVQRLHGLAAFASSEADSGRKVAVLASGEAFALADTSVHLTVFESDEALKAKGVRVIRLAPGCLCCSSKLLLQTHLGRLMRLNRPDILVIELDSSSHRDKVQELLESEQWKGWFAHVCIRGADR